MGQHSDFQNILVIHFGQLGDVVLGLSALKAIRGKFSAAKITLFVGKSAADIAKLADVADEYIVIDRVELRDGNKLRSVADVGRIVWDIRRRGFDLVIDLHSLSETNLLGFAAGIPNRLYANRENRSIDRLSNFRPRPPAEDKAKQLGERYFDVVLPLGVLPPENAFVLEPRSVDLASVAAKFPEVLGNKREDLVGLFPGAGHPSRCWPIGKFAALAEGLADNAYCPVVFLGPEEADLKRGIETSFPEQSIIIDGLTLPQFVAAASQISTFIANDTGPAHLAALAGVPIVLLLDERAPTTYLPVTEKLTVITGGTIDAIALDDVYLAAIRQMTNRGRA